MGLILLLRSTYARIDLGRIGRNIDELKRLSGTKVMAVVKADAYGHGMIKVTAEAMKHGVDFFAVATPDEAIELRENFLSPNILWKISVASAMHWNCLNWALAGADQSVWSCCII